MQGRKGEVSCFLLHPVQAGQYFPFSASNRIHLVDQQETEPQQEEEMACHVLPPFGVGMNSALRKVIQSENNSLFVQ